MEGDFVAGDPHIGSGIIIYNFTANLKTYTSNDGIEIKMVRKVQFAVIVTKKTRFAVPKNFLRFFRDHSWIKVLPFAPHEKKT